MIRHRVSVLGTWLVVAVLGALAATQLSSLLTTSLSVPGSDSARANQVLSRHFGENIEGTFTVVVEFHTANKTQIHSVEARIARAASELPSATITLQRALGGVLYANVTTSLKLIDAARETDRLRAALVNEGLHGALVTGPPALDHDLAPILSADLRHGQLVALVVTLALLIAILGWSWALLIPFVVAGATTSAAVGIVYLLARHFLMVLYIPNVIELVAFGLAVDYSLLMVHRFRSESELDEDESGAVLRTMASAGSTVLVSGVTVAIGLATLLLVPVPFVRSLGVAGLVVPLAASASTLTLQPALLSLLGGRRARAVGFAGLMGGSGPPSRRWTWVARFATSRPLTVLVGTSVVVGAVSFFAFGLQLTPGSVTTVPSSIESERAIVMIEHHVGLGAITPDEVVIDFGRAGGAGTSGNRVTVLRLAEAISRDPSVFAVVIDTKAPFVDSTQRYERIIVVGKDEFGAATSQHLVQRLRARYLSGARFNSGTRVYVGGPPAQGVDFLAVVYGTFGWILALSMLLAMILLARAFRSLMLATIAIVLDLVSAGVAYGVLVATFQLGSGSVLVGTYHVTQVEGWVPVFLFAMLFGLSMDYEVFLVARMRESYDRGLDTNEAIVEGLASTGGVVSAAALIMVGALSGLTLGRIAGLQELGVGLSIAVLVDATLVRGLMLPSAMALLGCGNWWLPTLVARALRIEPSPRRARAR